MAKYHLKNSNNTVNCEVLNESAGDYIVRFNNGVVQNVPKDRVTHLDKIDEGVLYNTVIKAYNIITSTLIEYFAVNCVVTIFQMIFSHFYIVIFIILLL